MRIIREPSIFKTSSGLTATAVSAKVKDVGTAYATEFIEKEKLAGLATYSTLRESRRVAQNTSIHLKEDYLHHSVRILLAE